MQIFTPFFLSAVNFSWIFADQCITLKGLKIKSDLRTSIELFYDLGKSYITINVVSFKFVKFPKKFVSKMTELKIFWDDVPDN